MTEHLITGLLKMPSPCFVYYPDTDEWVGREAVPEPILASYLGSVVDGNTWKLVVASGIDTLAAAPTGQLTQIFTENLGGGTTFALSVPIEAGWNMTSVPGINPDGMGVSDWWGNLTGTVYKFIPGIRLQWNNNHSNRRRILDEKFSNRNL